MNALVKAQVTSLAEWAGRQRIHDLETALIDMPGSTQEFDDITTHHFAPGMYARELFIPKGAVLTGKIHKTKHLNIVAMGKLVVATGQGRKILQAGDVILSEPGTKRAGFALEDTKWITIHATEETDLYKIEEEIIAVDYSDVPLLENQ